MKISYRNYLEQLLPLVGTLGTEIWDDVFCILRNNTNPKYGGHPSWQGEMGYPADHAQTFGWECYQRKYYDFDKEQYYRWEDICESQWRREAGLD